MMGMMTSLVKGIFSASKAETATTDFGIKRVLNTGGGSKATAISGSFAGWQHDLLDIDPAEIENSGQDFYAHKTGFSPMSLRKILLDGGFRKVFLATDTYLAVHALAFKAEPNIEHHTLLGQAWHMGPE